MRALLAVLLLAPLVGGTLPASGQAPPSAGVVESAVSPYVEDPGRALQPGANETLVVGINYRFQPGAQPAPGDDPTTESNDTAPTRVRLTVQQMPSWVDAAAFDPPVVEIELPTVSVLGSNAVSSARLVVAVSRDAPALQREDLVVLAEAEPNGNIAGSSGTSPPIKLRAAFVAKLNVTAEEAQVVPGGRWTVMPFTVRNDGNMETKVRLNVTAKPQQSEARFPESVTIPRNGSAVVEVELRLPWTTAQGGIVELEATPLLEDEEGRPARAEIQVLGQSAVPGAAPLLGVLVAVLLARRRR